MGTSVILSIFSYCWYSLQNQIFLTVSNNCLILNRKIQAGIRQTWIFRTPLGSSPVLITWKTMSVDSYFDCLIPRFYPPRWTNILSNWKVRGTKCMKVFISRLYLNYSRRNSRFPAQIASLLFEGLLHGIVWAHQWFWAFFPRLDIHSKTKFSWLYPNNCLILNRKIQAGIRQTWIFRTPLGG